MGRLILNTLFVLALLYASYLDIKTYTIDDKVHLIILILGIMKMDFLVSLIGMLIAGFPLFIVAMLSENKMGGGDVKLMLAVGFYLEQ